MRQTKDQKPKTTGREARENIPSFEMQMRDFKPFVNGKVNCHTPKGYNWLLGYPVLPFHDMKGQLKPNIQLSTARINGQHLAL